MSGSSIAFDARHQARPSTTDIDQLCINTIRTLAMDAVQAAKSGHPGTPMGLAPVAYTLWQQVLRYDPGDPLWPNRDRFVLSNGHASMLLYALLHLAEVRAPSGAAVTLSDIEQFRQLGGRCPGHPEYGHTVGVEVTTGPLGQGCGNSVGMAMAAGWLAAQFNRPDTTVFDYDVYTFCSDGDLMEGVSAEAASLAGHLRLSNLCWVYDNNHITIDGPTALAFDENVEQRFRGYGWSVVRVIDANDTGAVAAAFAVFRRTTDRPTLIIVNSHIGYGAPHKQDTSAAHGEPLGEDEVRLAKRAYGWPEDAHFLVPAEVYGHFRAGIGARGRALREAWSNTVASWRTSHPDLASRWDRLQHRELAKGWDTGLPIFPPDAKGVATRDACAKALNAIAQHQTDLLGGAADLATSTKAALQFAAAGDISATHRDGRNIHFGIREHAMGAVANGLAVSGLRPFASTFLIFSDYMKPPIRLAAMMQQPVIYIFTHDSIGLGEDGPTHQPIEQLAALRAIPGLITLRPADANETVEAWRVIMGLRTRPAALILTRQALPTLDRSRFASAAGLARGAYVLAEADGGPPDVILIGTGSEVAICIEARDVLARDRVRARVVSMPSWELFDEQDPAYRESVLPAAITARVSVEAACVLGWERYVGTRGGMIGMSTFGASAPGREVMRHFGFTAEAVAAAARRQLV
jgi:transketolase